jgi:acetoin utilization deacetylase AcuC-like enzyme
LPAVCSTEQQIDSQKKRYDLVQRSTDTIHHRYIYVVGKEYMKVFFNDDFTASRYAFETTRKSKFVADHIAENIPEAELTDPSAFYDETERLITNRHRVGYVLAVRDGDPRWMAESQGFGWDKGIYTMARAHNAGIVAAVDHVLSGDDRFSGSLSSGLHHAKANSGAGFCTFNGLAVGTAAARQRGANRILCLDFDAHCGGGTYAMTRDLGLVQIDVSTSAYDAYEIADGDVSRLSIVSGRVGYLDDIENALDYADQCGEWDLVLYNAGMDPVNSFVSMSELRTREQMVANWAKQHNYPTVFTLAGGYLDGTTEMDDLVNLHSSTVKAFSTVSAVAS